MGTLILMRHGETVKNAKLKLHNVNDQTSLNELGREQIHKTALKLRQFSHEIIYSSKELRARESAKILSDILNIPIFLIDGMQERNWGVYSNKSWDDVAKVLNPMNLDERYLYKPPKGESWKNFETRLKNAINKIVKNNRDKTIVIITHGGAIRALMPFLLNKPLDESFKYDPDNASLTIFDFDKNRFTKIAINDTSHLKG